MKSPDDASNRVRRKRAHQALVPLRLCCRFVSGGAVIAAEVGLWALLAGCDDAAADFAGAGEQLEQLVALAPADGPRQRLQVLGEAAEDLQHRVLVGQE